MQVAVKSSQLELDKQLKHDIASRTGGVFWRLREKIRAITVSFYDVNGPKGGVDKLCKLKVSLFGLPPLLVISKQESLHKALASALDKAKSNLTRRLKKMRSQKRSGGLRLLPAPVSGG